MNEEKLYEEHWVPLSLFLVEYPKGDVVGKVLALASLTPIALSLLHGGFFLLVRDCHSLLFGVGVVVNYIFNYGLKNFIKEPRPMPNYQREAGHQFAEFGMPSTHAQFMAFYVFYSFLFAVLRLPQASSSKELAIRRFFLAGLFALFALVVFGRVYLMYHTVDQVFYGSLCGLLMAYVWFWLVQTLFTPWFPVIANSFVAKLSGLKDLTHMDGVFFQVEHFLCSETRKRTSKSVHRKDK